MKISVVIPAYNEEASIAAAIKALYAQQYPRREFEILVVDNGSTDETPRIAKEAGADKVIFEKKKGTNFARERGRREAEGEIIAFLDADSMPPPDWLTRIEKDLSSSQIKAVSGPYDYDFPEVVRRLSMWYFRHIMPLIPNLLHFFFRKKAGVIIGGNFAARREVLAHIGGLPPLPFWGDDVATAMAVSRRAGKVLFDPDLIVKSSSRRFEKHGFLRLNVRYAFTYLKIYFQNW